MAVIYSNATKCARMNGNTTAAGATAVLEIGTSGMAVILATIPLDNPIAPGATGAGVQTLAGFPKTDSSADNTGTPAAARIRTSTGGADVITGLTVGLSAADVILNSLSITAGQAVTINSAVFTHAA